MVIKISKFRQPTYSLPLSCYKIIETTLKVGDIIEGHWLIIETGARVSKCVNLWFVDFVDSSLKISNDILIFSGKIQCNEFKYRYKVNRLKYENQIKER